MTADDAPLHDPLRSDLDVMSIQAAALFTHDANGRIVAVNEPGGSPAPRFFAGRTLHGTVRRYRWDVPELLVREIEQGLSGDRLTAVAEESPPWLGAVRALLAADRPITTEFSGPAFQFPPEIQYRGEAALISETNMHLLHGPFALLRPVLSERSPILAVVEDGVAVAVCYCSRRTTMAAEAGVETLPAHRGRGHASAAAAAWARAVRARRLLPLYSTSWDNAASRGVARRLGLRMYGVDIDIG